MIFKTRFDVQQLLQLMAIIEPALHGPADFMFSATTCHIPCFLLVTQNYYFAPIGQC